MSDRLSASVAEPPPSTNEEPPSAKSPSSSRKVLLLLLQVAVSVSLIGVAVSQVNLADVTARFEQLSAKTIWLFVSLTVGQIVLLVLRWQLIVQALGYRPAVASLIAGTLSERLINQVLPSTLGGDAMRAVQLLSAGVPRRAALLSILVDRGAGILGMFLLCLLIAPLGLFLHIADEVMVWSLLLGLAALAGFGAILFLAKLSSESRLPPRLKRLTPYAEDGLRLARSKRFILAAGPCSIAVQLVFCVIYVAIARDLAPELNFLHVMFLTPIILLTAAVPVTVNGWGLRETAAIAVFGGVGALSDAALSISIAFGLMQMMMGIGCGVALLALLAGKRLLLKAEV